MKFKLVEEFDNRNDLIRHFKKHVTGEIKSRYKLFPKNRYRKNSEDDMYEYEKDADELSLLEKHAYPSLSYLDDNSITLVGYIRKDGKRQLYLRDKNGTGEVVIYSDWNPSDRVKPNHHVIVTYFYCTDEDWKGFIENKNESESEDYLCELPHNEDVNIGPEVSDIDVSDFFNARIENRIFDRKKREAEKADELEKAKEKQQKALAQQQYIKDAAAKKSLKIAQNIQKQREARKQKKH